MRTLRLLGPDAWRSAPPSHGDAAFGALHPWLTSRGSLTSKLIAHAHDFNLVRLRQRAQLPNVDERRELGLRAREFAIVREVLLRDGDAPHVFAHSVVARRDVRGVWRGLSKLGGRPLADMLFGDVDVSRLPMEYKKIDARHPLYRRAMEVTQNSLPPSVWARRSVFLKRGRPLLVTEVFLDALNWLPHRKKIIN
jgi:chorismate--pyruvate lyase